MSYLYRQEYDLTLIDSFNKQHPLYKYIGTFGWRDINQEITLGFILGNINEQITWFYYIYVDSNFRVLVICNLHSIYTQNLNCFIIFKS